MILGVKGPNIKVLYTIAPIDQMERRALTERYAEHTLPKILILGPSLDQT
jgi:hypothetical protein